MWCFFRNGASTVVTAIFGGILQNEVNCLICGTESRKFDPFLGKGYWPEYVMPWFGGFFDFFFSKSVVKSNVFNSLSSLLLRSLLRYSKSIQKQAL